MHLFLHGREKPANLIGSRSRVVAGPDRAVEEFARRRLPEGCGGVAMQIAKLGGNLAHQDDLTVYWKGTYIC